MSECCGPSQPCCSTPPEYDYGPAPYVVGEVDTFAGPVPKVTTELTAADRRGALRVRFDWGRNDYRVRPGLYAIGEPDDTAPVLVTSNYKLTFDVVREQLGGRDLWLLVLDSRGVNVWCAAGKGTFSTAEVVRMVRESRLDQIVSHQRLVLPQLGATGVAGHEVRAQTGFAVAWGPVRAADIPAYLDAGMKVSPEMRRVQFPTRERFKLTGVELSVLWRPWALGVLGALILGGLFAARLWEGAGTALIAVAACLVVAVVAGAVVTPVLLPWVPGRAFSLKGALVGGALVALLLAPPLVAAPALAVGLVLAGAAVASYVAMNFTGSSTYTSPSGVEWEMRRAIPAQITAAVLGVVLIAAGAILARGGL